jgi:hypothetical protein
MNGRCSSAAQPTGRRSGRLRPSSISRSASVVDGGSLDYALRTLDRLTREGRLLERCVAQQAPRALLAELFGPQAVALAIPAPDAPGRAAPRGRPSLPDPDTRDRIHARWHALQATGLHPAERYLALAEDYPGLTLASLHAVVTSSRTSHGRRMQPRTRAPVCPWTRP